jgi:hypothetical protein
MIRKTDSCRAIKERRVVSPAADSLGGKELLALTKRMKHEFVKAEKTSYLCRTSEASGARPPSGYDPEEGFCTLDQPTSPAYRETMRPFTVSLITMPPRATNIVMASNAACTP